MIRVSKNKNMKRFGFALNVITFIMALMLIRALIIVGDESHIYVNGEKFTAQSNY